MTYTKINGQLVSIMIVRGKRVFLRPIDELFINRKDQRKELVQSLTQRHNKEAPCKT